MDTQHLWNATLGQLELVLSKANFTTWFKNTFIASYENTRVIIAVPNTFTKAWFENKYHDVILKALRNVTENQVTEIIYKVAAAPTSPERLGLKASLQGTAARTEPVRAVPNESGLDERYTFETFVVGKGNELAKAAARAVAESPGRVYNPLFFYGGVGLGKTHLMHAIGSAAKTQTPSLRVLYVTCEQFTNDFIHAISNGKGEQFKQRYRTVDLLLIDDIQFLAGKEGTQEEFFHTFNALHQHHKQIVLSSDRPPKAIPTLEQRLISRFEWGMVADITQPDLETRLAILNAKCKDRGQELAPEVLQYIASVIQTNIRELEGALNKLLAHTELNHLTPDLAGAKKILATLAPTTVRRGITPKQLIQTVAEYYDVPVDDVLGKSRKKELVVPRQIAMYLLREDLKSSFPTIGFELGNRDHTTAMHAYTKIQQQNEGDEKTRQDITLIRQRLFSA
ncbi:MAG: chromosomal replication initiator protein DnaA [Candidatus Kerfeldbacteria bacterium]|nr:chromosomal replication initiator protein DnaA [Candidatus Kerfeldbacteria bacterium]